VIVLSRRRGLHLLALLVACVPVVLHVRPAPASPMMAGLVPVEVGDCAGGYRLDGLRTAACTHGPDELPAPRPGPASTAEMRALGIAAGDGVFHCDGDGTSGRRVHVVYAHTPSTASRYAAIVDGLRAVVVGIQDDFADSVERHGGSAPLVPRFTHTPTAADGSCTPTVEELALPSDADDDSFGATIDRMLQLGYDDPAYRYLVLMDSSNGCGIGQFWDDDRPEPAVNANNVLLEPLFSRVDAPCWNYAETHELVHNLGGVQTSAPNASGFGHCNDDYDQLCYADGGPTSAMYVDGACAVRASDERLLDCNADDYFAPSPASGSYLASHWNVARSSWLFTPAAVVDVAPTVVVSSAALDTATQLLVLAGTVTDGTSAAVRVDVGDGTAVMASAVPDANAWTVQMARPVGVGTLYVTAEDADGLVSDQVTVSLDAFQSSSSGRFVDDDGSLFEAQIERLAELGVTAGCNPPDNDRYCPREPVTRGQMARFLVTAFTLPQGETGFTDTDAGIFAADVAALVAAQVTAGCNPPDNDLFCPRSTVTRGQMAAFLSNVLLLAPTDVRFSDTAGGLFDDATSALAAAGITRGCNPPDNDMFCPRQPVTRAQLAAFLVAALDG
jgi:hypothetical protein